MFIHPGSYDDLHFILWGVLLLFWQCKFKILFWILIGFQKSTLVWRGLEMPWTRRIILQIFRIHISLKEVLLLSCLQHVLAWYRDQASMAILSWWNQRCTLEISFVNKTISHLLFPFAYQFGKERSQLISVGKFNVRFYGVRSYP